ncbi:MAG: hypothetical protein ABL864_00940 [Terricaulis sp.]
MPTIDPPGARTAAESVARCTPLCTQHATPAERAQHPAQHPAQHRQAADVKALARQALERIEARNTPRNAVRNTGVAEVLRVALSAQHPAEHGRTAVSAADWRDLFEERAAIREHDGGMSRPDAETGALADLAQRWRAMHPQPASGDGVCVHCGKPGSDTPVLAQGGHAWIHRACWPAMDAARDSKALAAVRALLT